MLDNDAANGYGVLRPESPYRENLEMIKRCKYTRYPACRGDKDHIEGFIHIKDLYWNDEKMGTDERICR